MLDEGARELSRFAEKSCRLVMEKRIEERSESLLASIASRWLLPIEEPHRPRYRAGSGTLVAMNQVAERVSGPVPSALLWMMGNMVDDSPRECQALNEGRRTARPGLIAHRPS